jgi:hypothetical protein
VTILTVPRRIMLVQVLSNVFTVIVLWAVALGALITWRSTLPLPN